MNKIKANAQDLLINLRQRKSTKQLSRQLIDRNFQKTPFFVVCIPGCLHIVERCLRLIPTHVNTVLISNGLDSWENHWVKDNLPVSDILFSDSLLRHGTILDVLIDHAKIDFGILDYDCFIFQDSIIDKMKIISKDCMVNGVYQFANSQLNLFFPETFLLLLNDSLLKQIRSTFNVSANQINYNQLSHRIKLQLFQLGLDKEHLPEPHKPLIDTLRLLISLGYSQGNTCDFITKFTLSSMPVNQIFHVGGTSIPNNSKSYYEYRGSYFWRHLLETCSDVNLRSYYQSIFGKKSTQDLMSENPDYFKRITKEFFVMMDKIISD